jgi:5-methylthioadenosine/S-adenosylhomocysteine deaminase
LARQAGVPIICHIVGDRSGSFEAIGKAGLMGPDNEYIHCTQLNETHWKMIADTGGKISIAPAIEMQMRHGTPPLQTSIDNGIQPSLSVDVECNMTADMFTVRRTTFTLQRALINQRSLAGEENLPSLLGCRDVIEMATIGVARAAHLDHKIGTLSPGKEADMIMLAGDRINVFPLNNVPGTVVTLMGTSNVDSVFVAGKVVKWQGRLVGVDLGRLRRMVEKSRDGVLPAPVMRRICSAPAAGPNEIDITCDLSSSLPGEARQAQISSVPPVSRYRHGKGARVSDESGS